MKFVHKLILATLVPIAAIWWVAFYATRVGQQCLRDSIEAASVDGAEATMDEIARSMNNRIADWQSYINDPRVHATLLASNSTFARIPTRQLIIDGRDRDWRSTSADRSSPLMLDLLNNDLSANLRRRLATLDAANGYPIYGEVFITNAYGVNVAQTNRTSDYRQDDEDWWQRAAETGVYVGDLSYDESSKTLSTDICLRIDDPSGKMLGVMKAVLDIREPIHILESRAVGSIAGEGQHLAMFAADRRLIHSAGPEKIGAEDTAALFDGIDLGRENQPTIVKRIDHRTGTRYLSVFVRCAGHGSFRDLGWILLVEHRYDRIDAPVTRMRGRVIFLAILATLTAFAIGSMTAWSLSRRVSRLVTATTAFGQGNLDVRVSENGSDEIALLSRSFNSMATDLKKGAMSLSEQTRVLAIRNEELNREIEEKTRIEGERTAMEVQLRHAQRMESIGHLAAGIAHEINTPTQFVGDNTRFLADAFAGLQAILEDRNQLIESAKSSATTADLVALAEGNSRKVDLDYLVAEIPRALQQSLIGLDRISRIVGAMKEFSHPGSKEMTPADLNNAISNTILVSKAEWKLVADLVTDLDPQLPRVSCFVGDVNQAILNLIVNAAHAIGDATNGGDRGKGTISVRSRLNGAHAEISVTDTGTGVPESIRSKIFDPFFTTKVVGKGSGQGLAIVHAVVVQKHGGEIDVESEVGRGTTFTLRLPVS